MSTGEILRMFRELTDGGMSRDEAVAVIVAHIMRPR